jgi:hypothetical protein
MENSFDLNINNYSINDIEKFFGFQNKKYDITQIDNKAYTVREQLLSSGTVNKRFKRDLIAFLDMAKNLLIMKINNHQSPTTIPKNAQLDPINYPYAPTERYFKEGDIIQRPEKPFAYVKTDEYYSGKLNPLETRIINKCLTIDTRFRDNYYQSNSSDFIIQLPFKLNRVVSAQLASIELPISFYGISEAYGNNFFYITVYYRDENGNPTEATKKIIISDGNYNAKDLLDKINCFFNENEDIFSNLYAFLDISEAGSGTGKVTITTKYECCTSSMISYTIDFTKDENGSPCNTDIKTRLGWNLGFIMPIYKGSLTYNAEALIEPAGIRYVYLSVEDFNNAGNNMFLSVNPKQLDSNILARISLKGSYFSLVMENDFNIITEPRQYYGPVDIQRLRIRLLDDFGRVINMNHSDYSFCMNFKTVYDL